MIRVSLFLFSNLRKKTFGDACNEAIVAACVLHSGSIHDHTEVFDNALTDLCLNHRDLWGDHIRINDNKLVSTFQISCYHLIKRGSENGYAFLY